MADASIPASLRIDGHAIPRLCFGLGSLMKWAPGHTHPLPTDSSAEVEAALAAGFRHFDCGDLYTNTRSAVEAIAKSLLARSDIFISFKLNTYDSIKAASRQDIIDSVRSFIEDTPGLKGYVDVVQLHFPPRSKGNNLSNREAWAVLEDLKDQGLARIIGVSNFTLDDYKDIFEAGDLRHKPEVSEYELNPHLIFDPAFQARRAFELDHGIIPKHYGVLTPVTDRLSKRSASPSLLLTLDQLAQENNTSPHTILLEWAWENFESILVTSTSQPERAKALTRMFLAEGTKHKLQRSVYDRLEAAAEKDGFQGKKFYLHPHLEE